MELMTNIERRLLANQYHIVILTGPHCLYHSQ
jgi:hypothetical protein